MPKEKGQIIKDIINLFGGPFSKKLNIDLSSCRPKEIFKWFMAAILLGAPIPTETAS